MAYLIKEKDIKKQLAKHQDELKRLVNAETEARTNANKYKLNQEAVKNNITTLEKILQDIDKHNRGQNE